MSRRHLKDRIQDMSIIKKPVKKILWGMSLFLGLVLILFVKAFGINSLNRTDLSRVSMLGIMGVPEARADVPDGDGDGVGPGDGDGDGGGDGDSSY